MRLGAAGCALDARAVSLSVLRQGDVNHVSTTASAMKRCLGCGGARPDPFLDLGLMPLANSYLKPEQAAGERRYPLAVCYCPACQLVQITEPVPPEQLFTEYAYFSSFSDSFVEHARQMAESLVERFHLGPESGVLEIASNDGYLLRHFQREGVPVLGIEPARNIAAEARRRGVPTLSRFFGPDSVEEIRAQFGDADVIIGNNVLAHVPGINSFLGAVARCLKSTGVAVFEFPYLKDLLDQGEFDTIYHEHVFYYSLSAVSELARRASLELCDVIWQSVHGGSLRIFLQHRGAGPIQPSVGRMLADEEACGLTRADSYARFGARVAQLRGELTALLERLRSAGKRLAAYGAPAKGNTLLNYCRIDATALEFTVDRSPHKQGMLLPGSHLPILAPEELLARRPDYALILPWNIADEIVAQQREYVRRGGRFILPIPTPAILENGHR